MESKQVHFEEEKSLEPISEETFTKEEVLKGDMKIPLRDVFAFAVDHITLAFGNQIGAGNALDRNFTFFNQLTSRKQMSKITSYTFLHPLLTEKTETATPVLISIAPCDKCKTQDEGEIDKKTFIIYVLEPVIKKDEPRLGLLQLHEIFQSTIRPDMSQSIQLVHILKSIKECHENGYLHFAIEADENTKTIWSFEYYNQKLFAYEIPYSIPFEFLEKSAISPWISTTEPYFRRNIASKYVFEFSDEEIQSILNDKDVIGLKEI